VLAQRAMKVRRDAFEDLVDLVMIEVSKVLVIAIKMSKLLKELLFQAIRLSIIVIIIIIAAEINYESQLKQVVINVVHKVFL